MSWFLAVGAIVALVIIHELGHFTAAKVLGFRVERFSLFFGPVLFSVRRGETEYALSAIPLGGYVRVTGQNPQEELPPELAARGYFAQPVWRRVIFILAGPVANLVTAFVILWIALLAFGIYQPSTNVLPEGLTAPAASYLKPGDHIVSIDGHQGGEQTLSEAISSHRCAGRPYNGCRATTPARVVVLRGGRRLTFDITPRYNSSIGRTLVGLEFGSVHSGVGPAHAASLGATILWQDGTQTVHALTHVFSSKDRKQLNGIVGGVYATQQAINTSAEQGLLLIALISLALAVGNLLPILPLDGGHLLWAVLEKLRGRPISYEAMARFAVVGIVLILALAYVGLSNDITDLGNGSLHLSGR
jgi:regulator of sigma E protease